MATKETKYEKDLPNKKIRVEREFDAPVEKVWNAWTKPTLLDQWWAPKPWKAVTKSMEFREGGRWFYYMEGPDGTRQHCIFDYKSIQPTSEYTGKDAFCDEAGNINKEMPSMNWKTQFSSKGAGTTVNVEISFASEADLENIVKMGFQEGFAAGHSNLDELLARS